MLRTGTTMRNMPPSPTSWAHSPPSCLPGVYTRWCISRCVYQVVYIPGLRRVMKVIPGLRRVMRVIPGYMLRWCISRVICSGGVYPGFKAGLRGLSRVKAGLRGLSRVICSGWYIPVICSGWYIPGMQDGGRHVPGYAGRWEACTRV